MGRVNPQLTRGPSEPKHEEQPELQAITHFSHAHTLSRTVEPLPPVGRTVCDGCWLPCSGVAYACASCDYVLHKSCAIAPRSLRHQGHAGHALVFVAKPPHLDGAFNCDACGKRGTGFCFRCAICDFDLHVPCATLPEQVKHPSHQHQLSLLFAIPYPVKVFTCDICHLNGIPSHWVYHCAACGFDAHLHCATTSPSLTHHTNLNHHQQQRSPAATVQQPPHIADPDAQILASQRQELEQLEAFLGSLRHHTNLNLHQLQSSPASTVQEQPPLADPYAEILARQRQEMEQLTAFFRAQSAMQDRMTSELLQVYQRPVAQVGYPNAGGGGSGSMEALVQQMSGMGLNNGGGLGGGGGGPSGLLSQLISMGGQGGVANLASLLGGGGGLDLSSLASLFFS